MKEKEIMKQSKLSNTVAYCGLICGICKYGQENCKLKCKGGDGDPNCFQKKCCQKKGINGCWECDDFPCDKGHFAHGKGFRGINIASCQCIKDEGADNFVKRVVKNLGDIVSYGEHSCQDPEDFYKKIK